MVAEYMKTSPRLRFDEAMRRAQEQGTHFHKMSMLLETSARERAAAVAAAAAASSGGPAGGAEGGSDTRGRDGPLEAPWQEPILVTAWAREQRRPTRPRPRRAPVAPVRGRTRAQPGCGSHACRV